MRTNRREHSEHRQPLHLQPTGWRKTISTKSGREIVLSRSGDAQISKRRNWGRRYPRSSFVPSNFPAALRYHSSRQQENRNLLILAPIGLRAMESHALNSAHRSIVRDFRDGNDWHASNRTVRLSGSSFFLSRHS